MQNFIKDLNKLTKTRKFSRKHCMKLKNNQFIRINDEGYYRVISIDKLNKIVYVFENECYDFDDVTYDKICELLDIIYKNSKLFRQQYKNLKMSQLQPFIQNIDKYLQEPDIVFNKLIGD